MAYKNRFLQARSASDIDLTDPATREMVLAQLGIEPPQPKANLLERLGSLFSFTETGNAVYTLLDTGDPLQAAETYLEDVVGGVTGAFTGDINRDKKTYADVVKQVGISDPTVAAIVGFGADVLTDPLTYVGVGAATKFGKIGGRAITSTGKKIALEAEERAMGEILSLTGKYSDDALKGLMKEGNLSAAFGSLINEGGKVFDDALQGFAKSKGITTQGPVGLRHAREVLDTFKIRELEKVSQLTGNELIEAVSKFGATETEIFEKNTFRFMGKKIFDLSDNTTDALKVVVDPLEVAAKYTGQMPYINKVKDGLGGMLEGTRKTLGQMFDPYYSVRSAGLMTFGRQGKMMMDFVDNVKAKTGMDADYFFEQLGSEEAWALPYLIDKTNPMDLPELKRVVQEISEVDNSFISKMLGTEVKYDDTIEMGRTFIARINGRDGAGAQAIIDSIPDNDPRALLKQSAEGRKAIKAEEIAQKEIDSLISKEKNRFKADLLRALEYEDVHMKTRKGFATVSPIPDWIDEYDLRRRDVIQGVYEHMTKGSPLKNNRERRLFDKLNEYAAAEYEDGVTAITNGAIKKARRTQNQVLAGINVEKAGELSSLKKAMQRMLDNYYGYGGEHIKNRMYGVLKDLPDGDYKKNLITELKKLNKPSRQKLESFIGSIENNETTAELIGKLTREMDSFEDVGGKYMPVIGGYIVKAEHDGLSKMAFELQRQTDEFNQAMSEMGMEDLIENYFGRKSILKGEKVLFDRAGNPIPGNLQGMNPRKVLGQERYWEMRIQGIEDGDMLYAIEAQMSDPKTGKILEWNKLSKAQKKNVRAEVSERVYETRVKRETAVRFYNFLKYTRDYGTTDSGEKLLLKTTDIAKEGLDALKQQGWREINTEKGGKMLKDFVAPKEVADMIEGTYDAFFTDQGTQGILKLYDKLNSLWKTSVTSWFPAFHVRNGMSNIFSNAMAGVLSFVPYRDARKVQAYMNKLAQHGVDEETLVKLGSERVGNYTVAEVVDLAEKYGAISSKTFYTEASEHLNSVRPGIVRRWDPTSKSFVLTEVGGKFGNYIEDNARLAHFIDKLNKGWGIQDAADSVKKTLFDYGELTAFEKNVMRRIVPFYTWQRKNAEFLLRFAVNKPGTFGNILKGYRDIQDAFTELTPEQIASLPQWARDGFSIVTSEDAKNVLATTGFGTPIEASAGFFGQLLGTEDQSTLSQLGPIPKGFLETTTGLNIFTGKPISEDTGGKKFRNLPGFVKDAVGYRETPRETKDGRTYIEYHVNPYAKYYLNLYLGRIVADSAKLADLQADPTGAKLLNFISGIRSYEFNLDEEEQRRQNEAAEELLKALSAEGYASEFTVRSLNKDVKDQL